jgi:hypothetical protein
VLPKPGAGGRASELAPRDRLLSLSRVIASAGGSLVEAGGGRPLSASHFPAATSSHWVPPHEPGSGAQLRHLPGEDSLSEPREHAAASSRDGGLDDDHSDSWLGDPDYAEGLATRGVQDGAAGR